MASLCGLPVILLLMYLTYVSSAKNTCSIKPIICPSQLFTQLEMSASYPAHMFQYRKGHHHAVLLPNDKTAYTG